jgi:hypothetical protein
MHAEQLGVSEAFNPQMCNADKTLAEKKGRGGVPLI